MPINAALETYSTCAKCYATICIYCRDYCPEFVTNYLGIVPTKTTIKGESASEHSKRIHPLNAWFLSSKDSVSSKDLRDHLDWLFDKFAPSNERVVWLREHNCDFVVYCYWVSSQGEGGPILSVPQIKNMADLEFEFWLDVRFETE